MACEGTVMLGWAVTFLIIAVIAGLLGFGGVAIISAEMAKIIFFVPQAFGIYRMDTFRGR
jgi:uncharacterized membrane protein YtjA (UPF0391 family)